MSSVAAASSVDEFIASVSPALDSAQVAESGLAAFEVDGQTPDVAVEPNSLEQLQMVLSEAQEAGLAAIPVGGATQLAIGNTPSAYDLAISTARLRRVVEHEPADLTVTVHAGLRLVDLQARLREHGQFLPLDPPVDDAATVGGILATNAFGPLRHAYGTARDWLIGIRVVHADGSTSKAGGRVVKNVAGYDMTKLYIGSLGTLGVIAEATFKVAPSPRSQSTVAAGFDTARAACAFATAAHDAGLSLQAAEVLSPPTSFAVLGEHRWTALARVAGGAGAVERTLRELHGLASLEDGVFELRDGEQVWPGWRRTFAAAPLLLRASVLPSDVADTIEVLDRRFVGAAAQLSATVSAGVVRARLEPTRDARAGALIERAREVAERTSGSVVVDAASAALKRHIDVFGPLRPDFALMKRLKEEFDPQRILSPGRFVGRL